MERARTSFAAAGVSWAVPAAAVVAAYVAAGKLGLRLAVVNPSATAVWAPSGIALGALVLLGIRYWPAVFAGAFLVNVTTTGALASSLGIAAGNTLEAVVGAVLLERLAGGRRALLRSGGVFRFVAISALAAAPVSATVGVTSLALTGAAVWRDFLSVWTTWWLGDIGGALIVAPAIILWGSVPKRRWSSSDTLERLAVALCVAAVGAVVFHGVFQDWLGDARYPIAFACVPFLLWSAFRLGPFETAASTALLAAIAVHGTYSGTGPFARDSANESLLLLQAFLGVTSTTALATAAAVAARLHTEDVLGRTAAIVDSSDDAILGKDLHGTIVSWNGGAERLYGYRADEVIGRNVTVLSPPELAHETDVILDRIRRGESVRHIDVVRLTKDGRRLDVSLTVSPIHDAAGTVVGASAIGRDITRRRRAERRLATQSAVTRVLAEAASVRDAAPRLLKAVCEGLGWAGAELWRADPEDGALRREDVWPRGWPLAEGSGCGALTELPSGRDLAGRVWTSGSTLWIEIPESASDPGTSHPTVALAVPVPGGTTPAAVLVFYGRSPHGSREELVQIVEDLGSRIALFLGREQAVSGLRRLEAAVETLDLGVTISDLSGRILYANAAEAALHGYRTDELIGRHVSIFMPASWPASSGRPPTIRSWRRETVNVRRDGTLFPVQLVSDAILDADGRTVGIVTCCEEITERKRAEEALRASEARYRLFFERNLAGVYRATTDGRLIECNDAFARILGYGRREEVLALPARQLFFTLEEFERCFTSPRQKGSRTHLEVRMKRRDGASLWVLQNQNVIQDDDGFGQIEGTLIDITERKLAVDQIEFQAYHDTLTGLPNRTQLKSRMRLALAQARRARRGLAVVFLDIDRFKEVNDALGHAAGDRLLQEVAQRLKECVREEDTVARVGGDEFVLVLQSARHAEGAVRIARKVLARIQEPLAVDGEELRVTTSLGVALFPQDGDDEEMLLRGADNAMYRAKQAGGDRFFCFDPATDRQQFERLALQGRLRRALDQQELAVLYQPQLDLRSGRVVGLEALLRWHDPQGGILLPGEFLPLAEEAGLLPRFGAWTLETACAQVRRWQVAGQPSLRLSVNVSPRELAQANLKDRLQRTLSEAALAPADLDIEITESAAMQSTERTTTVLKDLASLGIGISVDDFGTGSSSLGQLSLLPLRRLKVDRPFVAALGHEPRDNAFVKAVVRMAHALRLSVVAEGVETENQREVLKRLHCDEIQGWLVSPPLSVDGVERLFAKP